MKRRGLSADEDSREGWSHDRKLKITNGNFDNYFCTVPSKRYTVVSTFSIEFDICKFFYKWKNGKPIRTVMTSDGLEMKVVSVNGSYL